MWMWFARRFSKCVSMELSRQFVNKLARLFGLPAFIISPILVCKLNSRLGSSTVAWTHALPTAFLNVLEVEILTLELGIFVWIVPRADKNSSSCLVKAVVIYYQTSLKLFGMAAFKRLCLPTFWTITLVEANLLNYFHQLCCQILRQLYFKRESGARLMLAFDGKVNET